MPEYKFYTTPWEHQLKALDFLYQRDIGALYTDMGTGKSKIMIDLIYNRKFQVTLIACTKKGCQNWVQQFKRHCPQFDRKNIYNLTELTTNSKTILLKKLFQNSGDFYNKSPIVLICNYESIWREPFGSELLKRYIHIDCVICDESHRIKSPSSKCSRFLSRLGQKVSCRYLVTGTPLAENPVDIYAQYKFLDPSIFGTRLSDFREKYLNIDSMLSSKVGYIVLDKDNPYKNLDDLHQKIFSCAFYGKSSVKLPKKHNIVYFCGMDSNTQKYYKELSKTGVVFTEKGNTEVSNVLTLGIRQQQLLSGYLPVIPEDLEEIDAENNNIEATYISVNNQKQEALEELLLSLPSTESVVIFARFRYDFEQIKALCQKINRGYSEISGVLDTEKDWQQGKTSVLAVQYESGSESIDLTRAHYCVYYSLTYSLAKYLQSKKRLHRPGQTHSVTYYHIIGKLSKGKSIDELILSALKSKQDVITYIMSQEQEVKNSHQD